MSPVVALALVLGAPLAQALFVLSLARPPGLRDVVNVLFSLVTAAAAFFVFNAVAHGAHVRIAVAQPLPNVDIAFSIEPLGALIAAATAALGVLHAIHVAGTVRATQERAPARLMALIALATAAAMAAIFAANIFTFFVASQALTLATFPLIAFGGDERAQAGARTYLATLLIASFAFFLPAMVWTYALTGTLEFRSGGLLAGRADVIAANVLLGLYVFGLASTGIAPLHRWLTRSSDAGFPALVMIQALTVLPVGGVGLIKISAYVFGHALHQAVFAARGLLALTAICMCVAALIALSKQDLRERLAYSCMAQSMAIVAGALLALPQGLFAAALQLVALSCAVATLLMAGGAVQAATGRTEARQYAGLARLMPWTFAGFALGAASMVGMPPFSGAWAKLWLITASADAGLLWAAAAIGLAAVLTFAHLGPLAASAVAAPAPPDAFKRPDGASIMLVAPVLLSGLATLVLLVSADALSRFLGPLWTVQP